VPPYGTKQEIDEKTHQENQSAQEMRKKDRQIDVGRRTLESDRPEDSCRTSVDYWALIAK